MNEFKEFLLGMKSELPNDVLVHIYAMYLISQFGSDKVMGYLSKNGNLMMIIYILSIRDDITFTTDNLLEAIDNGHLNIVKWASDNYPDVFQEEDGFHFAIDHAASNCKLDIVKFLHEKRKEVCDPGTIIGAAYNGNLDTVMWIHENAGKFAATAFYSGTEPVDEAARQGHLDVVKYLVSKGYKSSTNAIDLAAENGKFDTLIWLSENTDEGCTEYAINWAAENGHLDIVKFIHEKYGYTCDYHHAYRAKKKGFNDIYKYCLRIDPDLER